MNRYIGIDPGSKGCVVVLFEDDKVFFHDIDAELSTYWNIMSVLEDNKAPTYVAVEDVHGRPGQSCVANTTFMKLAGCAELTGWSLASAGFLKVAPQTWKKHFGLLSKGLTKTQRKHLSIDLAKELYPSVADQLTASKDGRAEALLIARYMKDVCRSS
jgi:hypothetical protein